MTEARLRLAEALQTDQRFSSTEEYVETIFDNDPQLAADIEVGAALRAVTEALPYWELSEMRKSGGRWFARAISNNIHSATLDRQFSVSGWGDSLPEALANLRTNLLSALKATPDAKEGENRE